MSEMDGLNYNYYLHRRALVLVLEQSSVHTSILNVPLEFSFGPFRANVDLV